MCSNFFEYKLSGLNFIMSEKKYIIVINDKVVLVQWAEYCRNYSFWTTISSMVTDE